MSYNKQLFLENLIHPWITLQEILDSTEMSQKELAFRVGVTPKHINWIVNWKDNITPDVALKFEKVLWVSASFWNNLKKSYDEDKVRIQERELLKNEEKEVEKFTCYKELVKLWLVEKTLNKWERLNSLLKFFSISSLSMLDKSEKMFFWKFAFRKYENKNFSKENFICWLRIWEIIWNKIEVEDFSKQKLLPTIHILKELTKNEIIDISKLQEVFSKIGIRFVFVRWFENSPIAWLTKKFKWKPLIQISDRLQKNDIFWFTVFHEIWHVLNHLSNDDNVFINYWEKNTDQIEIEADKFAQWNLINNDIYEKEINKRIISIDNIAENSKVWKCIVAWRIAHDFHQKSYFWWNIWSLVNKYRIKLNVINTQL